MTKYQFAISSHMRNSRWVTKEVMNAVKASLFVSDMGAYLGQFSDTMKEQIYRAMRYALTHNEDLRAHFRAHGAAHWIPGPLVGPVRPRPVLPVPNTPFFPTDFDPSDLTFAVAG